MGYDGPWFAWVRGCVGCVGQTFSGVALVMWVKIFCTWVIIFTWGAWVKHILCVALYVGQNFLCGSKIIAWAKFVLGGSTLVY